MIYSVAEVAEMLGLKEDSANGKPEWHGANPTGNGAAKDGFILYLEGNALDRKTDTIYKSFEVARMAGIDPGEYEPCAEYSRQLERVAPHTNGNGYSSPLKATKNGSSNGKATAVASKAESAEQKEAAPVRTLEERGVSKATLAWFHIALCTRSNKNHKDYRCYEYPAYFSDGVAGRCRQKVLDPSQTNGQKYFWAGGDKDSMPVGYNLHALPEAVKNGVRECYVVESEVSTWLLHQAGVVVCNPFGAGRHLPELMREIKRCGITNIHIVFDCDLAGRKAAGKAASCAQEAELGFTVRRLPGGVNSGYDASDLATMCASDDALKKALENLPRLSQSEIDLWMKKGEDEAPKPEEKSESEKEPKVMRVLALLKNAQVFHSDDDECYITFLHGDHSETYPIGESRFTRYLGYLWRRETGRTLESSVIDETCAALESEALWNSEKRRAWIRTAYHTTANGIERIYIDLCNDKWEVIEIGEDIDGGWRITTEAPVHFRRAKGMEPLPTPVRGGKWDELRGLLNAEDEENWILIVSWLITALRPHDLPYPLLAVHGEQDSGKSSMCRMLRGIVDPNYTSLIGASTRDERDLAIIARNSFVIGFDNLSGMKQWFNDVLCSLVTEGCFRTRKLRTDNEEVIFKARRPMILNGINENVGQNDLRRRSLRINLPPFPAGTKRDESQVKREFDAAWPRILGLICDAMSVAAMRLPGVDRPISSGLVDFAKWVIAAEPVLPWEEGRFAEVYLDNQQESIEAANEASAFVQAILKLLDTQSWGAWEGTATEMKTELERFVSDDERKSHAWPHTASGIGHALNRVAPNLRAIGVEITRFKDPGGGARKTRLSRKPVKKDKEPTLVLEV
jgi:energy-coupling factor transporter ATP-binding protein EcfA2